MVWGRLVRDVFTGINQKPGPIFSHFCYKSEGGRQIFLDAWIQLTAIAINGLCQIIFLRL